MGRLSSLSISLMMTTVLSSGALAQTAPKIVLPEFNDEIVVRAVNIPDEKRATSEISNVLTDVKLERAGDSDIAGALRRVTGLSLSQGKFVIVRGLNERYSSVTLNGSPLPSPEPLRRVAPLDLFPTSIVSNVLVQKTFSPEYSAEFGGGLIELRSKALPDETFFEFKTSIALNTITTGRDGLTFDGGELDFLGFEDGTRNFPDTLEAAFAAQPGIAVRSDTGAFSDDEVAAIGAAFPLTETAVIQSNPTPVNHGFNVAGGTSYDVNNDIRLGFVSNLGYSRNFQTKIGQQGNAAIDAATGEVLNGPDVFDFESLTETILLNGLLSGGVEIGDNHELNVTGVYLRKTTKEARERNGTSELSFGGFDEILISNLEFFENQVWSLQGYTEHVLPALNDLTINTRVAYSEAFREAPFETEFIFGSDGATAFGPNGEFLEFRSLIGLDSGASSSGFSTQFSDVEDTSFSGGIDFELPLVLFDSDITFKAGYAYSDNNRNYELRSFSFLNDTGLPDDDPFFFQRIDSLLRPANLGEGGFRFAQNTDEFQPSAYVGSLETQGAYFGLDAEINSFVRIAAGFRYEESTQIVDNFSIAGISGAIPNDPTQPESFIEDDFFLPAVTVTWNAANNLQLRAGFSQTITRPQFQELGDAFFTDTDRDLQVFGNPFLVNTETNNYDLRLEYYFGREQFVTIGGFFKQLTNPIEESLTQTGDDINVSFINAPSADLYGFEFEYEQRFYLADLIGDNWFSGGKDLVLSTNYTWSQSEVSTDGDVTINLPFGGSTTVPAALNFADGRALQGQSDHIVNGQIGYEDADQRSRAFILVNWASERIRQVGLLTGGTQVPDTVERLPLNIDFVYAKEFDWLGSRDWKLEVKFQNILGDNYEATADGANGTSVAIDVYDLGQIVSASISKRF